MDGYVDGKDKVKQAGMSINCEVSNNSSMNAESRDRDFIALHRRKDFSAL